MAALIEQILAVAEFASPVAQGEWKIEEDQQVTLLVEVGQGVIGLERVTSIKLLGGGVAVICSARETHYLPVERLVGLKVAGTSHAGGGKRAGFV